MRSHGVTCHPSQVNTLRLNTSHRPVLDLPTPEGWKAELICVSVRPIPSIETTLARDIKKRGSPPRGLCLFYYFKRINARSNERACDVVDCRGAFYVRTDLYRSVVAVIAGAPGTACAVTLLPRDATQGAVMPR